MADSECIQQLQSSILMLQWALEPLVLIIVCIDTKDENVVNYWLGNCAWNYWTLSYEIEFKETDAAILNVWGYNFSHFTAKVSKTKLARGGDSPPESTLVPTFERIL